MNSTCRTESQDQPAPAPRALAPLCGVTQPHPGRLQPSLELGLHLQGLEGSEGLGHWCSSPLLLPLRQVVALEKFLWPWSNALCSLPGEHRCQPAARGDAWAGGGGGLLGQGSRESHG